MDFPIARRPNYSSDRGFILPCEVAPRWFRAHGAPLELLSPLWCPLFLALEDVDVLLGGCLMVYSRVCVSFRMYTLQVRLKATVLAYLGMRRGVVKISPWSFRLGLVVWFLMLVGEWTCVALLAACGSELELALSQLVGC